MHSMWLIYTSWKTSRRRIAGTDRAASVAPDQATSAEEALPKVKEEEPTAQDPLRLELDDDDLDRRARDAQAHDKQDKAKQDAAEAEAVREGTEEAQAVPASTDTAAASSGSGGMNASSPAALAKLKSMLLHAAVDRICAIGADSGSAIQAGGGDKDLWIQLISRLVTRGLSSSSAAGEAEEQEQEEESENIKKEKDSIRKQLFDFVTADLSGRIELARLWLNEEWYTESVAKKKPSRTEADQTPYAVWLHQLLDHISNSSIDKEKGTAFTQFFVDLPEIPKEELTRLAKMCEEPSA